MTKKVSRRSDARGEIISDIPDFVSEDEQFKVTWRFTNRGSADWDADYSFFQTSHIYGFNKKLTPHPLGAPRRVLWGEMTDRERVAPGETVEFTVTMCAPEEAGNYVRHWQLRDGEENDVGYPVFVRITVPALSKDFEFADPATIPQNLSQFNVRNPVKLGMNLNPDNHAENSSPELLKGVNRVRIVVKSYLREAKKWQSLEHYQDIIGRYHAAGVNVLLVLNQETVIPEGGWHKWDTPIDHWQKWEWTQYVNKFAQTAIQLAKQFSELNKQRPGSVAFQIWNEGDQELWRVEQGIKDRNAKLKAGEPKFTLKDAYTLAMDEWKYAELLSETSKAIKGQDKQAPVVTMGLVMCDIGYFLTMHQRNQWTFTHVDALAAHPYDCVAAGFNTSFPFAHNYKSFKKVLKKVTDDAKNIFKKPVWITEVGPKLAKPTDPWHIANFMRTTYYDFALNHTNIAEVFWFPWSDFIGTIETSVGGVIDRGGGAKPAMWSTFEEVRNWLAGDTSLRVARPNGKSKPEPKKEPVEKQKEPKWPVGKTPTWKYGRCLIGLHDRAERHPEDADFAIAAHKFETIKIQTGPVGTYRKYHPKENFYLSRIYYNWEDGHRTAEQFMRHMDDDLTKQYNDGIRYFEMHNEPNLSHEGMILDGGEGSWRDGKEFAELFIDVRNRLKQKFPEMLVGFPGLSPGPSAHYTFGPDSGMRRASDLFLREAKAGIEAADFLCCHAYYTTMQGVPKAIEEVKTFRRLYPHKLLFVTEFGNPDPERNIPVDQKAKQARRFFELCRHIPGVGAAYYYIVSGHHWDHQALRDGQGRSTGMIEKMLPPM